jgi:hypothetical protein
MRHKVDYLTIANLGLTGLLNKLHGIAPWHHLLADTHKLDFRNSQTFFFPLIVSNPRGRPVAGSISVGGVFCVRLSVCPVLKHQVVVFSPF